MSRFDFVAYDMQAVSTQATAKQRMEELERFVSSELKSPRAKALVLTKLEEAYMWIGKAIRDDQIERNSSATLQEERTNS